MWVNFKGYRKRNIVFCVLLCVLAFTNLFLLLRHKSPYLSDSYFYQHIYYSYQGDGFDTAYQKTLQKIDVTRLDPIEANIFLDKKVYKDVLGFFIKRPLYPLFAFLLNRLGFSEFAAFLIPEVLGYIGCVVLVFLLFSLHFKNLFALVGSFMFISFYPFVDWSTYFLTDTIGAFFWFLQMVLGYYYLKSGNKKYLWSFLLALILSLLTREQSLLQFITFILFYIFFAKTNKVLRMARIKNILSMTFVSLVVYMILSYLTHQKNIIDTLVYTYNSYGLYSREVSANSLIGFLIQSIVSFHRALIVDIFHYRSWLYTLLLACYGLYMFLTRKKDLIAGLIFCSSFASYAGAFIYPVLSYRYFFPLVFGIIFFALFSVNSYFALDQENREQKTL